MRYGILGGSFNPPHRGHLALASTVLELSLADRVVLIPAASPPHKAAPREADPETRLAMTRLLAGDDRRLDVSDIELRRSGPSFTVDTVRQLLREHPAVSYRLVLGSDQAKAFATWREYKALLELAPPLVAERPDDLFEADAGDRYPGLTPEEAATMERGRFAMTPVDVSSTKVRRLLNEGAPEKDILECLTEPVYRFVREHGLYAPLG